MNDGGPAWAAHIDPDLPTFDVASIAASLRDDEPDDGPDRPRPFTELGASGLLWLINASVFHPRGFALGLELDADGNAIGWRLHGDGSRPWSFDTNLAETMMDAAWATLNERRPPLQPLERETP